MTVDRTSPRWRRLRAACCSISGLTDDEVDAQADRVFNATRHVASTNDKTRAGSALEGVRPARVKGGKAR